MAKLTLNDLTNITGSETSAITMINGNSDAIEEALENTLSRDGTSPNQMEADLDLNDNDILNVGQIDAAVLILGGTEVRSELLAVGPPGPQGEPGPQGPSGAGTGDMLGTNNLSDVADASTAFNNIKQAATESASGVLEIATNAEVATGSDAVRAITPAGLASISPARLTVEDQVLSGGARVTVKDLGNLSGASITPDPGDRPIQKITNNGAGSVLPGSNEGSYLLEIINTTGAGTITTTGWTKTGSNFDTTTTSKFLCSCLVTSDMKVMAVTKVA